MAYGIQDTLYQGCWTMAHSIPDTLYLGSVVESSTERNTPDSSFVQCAAFVMT